VGLNRLSIAHRLVVGFLVVVLAMVVVTALGVSRVEQVSNKLTVINDLNSVKQRYAINFRGSVHDRAISLRDVVLATTPAELQEHIADIGRLGDDYAASATKLDEFFADDTLVGQDEKNAYGVIQGIEGRALPLVEQVIALSEAGSQNLGADVLRTQAAPVFTDWLASINALIDLEETKNMAEGAEARRIADGFLMIMMIFCGLAVVLAIAVAWRIARSITGPMADAVTVFAAVADGDLTQRLDVASKDGLGEMGQHANAALARMGDAMAAVAQSAAELAATSDRVGEASHRIAGNAQESATQADVVAGAAEEVSRSVQTVAAGSEEMGASIREIAHNASEAAQVAGRAVAAAETTNTTVSRLGASSREIGDVVKVISSIAEQTNPAGAERHHRGRPRRRGRQGLRSCGQRGQGARAGDRPGHRGHRPPGGGHPGRHRERRGGDRGGLRRHRPDQRLPDDHRLGGRGADGDDVGDEPQRLRGIRRLREHRGQHRRGCRGRPIDLGVGGGVSARRGGAGRGVEPAAGADRAVPGLIHRPAGVGRGSGTGPSSVGSGAVWRTTPG
jgi:methyl-accepting chemotaxis protein